MRLWSLLQAAVEYGAATSQAVGASPDATGPARLSAWATEHQAELIAAGAGLFLLFLIRASSERR